MSKKIAVIGGGIAGLACAYQLQESGHTVTLYEKNPHVGGRMSSRSKDGLLFDIGATHLIPLYSRIRHYSKKWDIPFHEMDFVTYGLVRNGTIKPIYQQISRVTRAKLALTYMKVGNTIENTFNLSNAAQFDTTDGYTDMEQRVNKEAADYLADPFTAAYQFHGARKISKAALDAILQSLKREVAQWQLHRTKDGMQALPDAFAAAINDVRKNTPVNSVVADEETGKVHIAASDGTEIYDGVVFASTANATEEMYTNPTDAQATLLHATEYAPTISLAFKVKKDQIPKTSITWVPRVENEFFSGISNEQMKGDDLINNDGDTLLCTWLHADKAAELMDKTDEEVFAITRKAFTEMCPWITDESELRPHDLERWTHSMPVFKKGHIKLVVDFLKNKDGQGAQQVWFCGDYLNSPWTEGALQCGERVAKRVTAHFESAQ